ncbi:CagC family type IV secretion system protein [Cytobacillus horneckiae]|uniref:CagC family type IV secretion system protein n=1 Tax=Cytobacillus horneckiae TaxID=549687 RepID=UPI003D1CA89F
MFLMKVLDNANFKFFGVLTMVALMFFVGPEIGLASSTSTVQTKLKNGATAFQTVLTGIVVVVGIAAALKIVVKHLPGIDDPHVKNEMWKSIGAVLAAVGAGAALVWILPWVYSLFK